MNEHGWLLCLIKVIEHPMRLLLNILRFLKQFNVRSCGITSVAKMHP